MQIPVLDTVPSAPFKMAGRQNISHELFNAMKSRDYCDFVQNIGVKDCLGIQMFKESTWGTNYNVDTSLLHRNGRRTNNNHVYQMFGELSGMEAEEVRIAMLNEITTSYEWYERRCMAVLNTLDMSLSRWLARRRG